MMASQIRLCPLNGLGMVNRKIISFAKREDLAGNTKTSFERRLVERRKSLAIKS